MTAPGRFAYANARTRARRSQLFTADTTDRLLLLLSRVRPREVHVTELRATGDRVEDLTGLPSRRFRELVASYRTMLRAYPLGQSLLLALVRLHEIENLKLVWRALVRQRMASPWHLSWRPLEDLATLDAGECRSRTSLSDFVNALKKTPYGAVSRAVLASHAGDLPAAELAFDAWASSALARAARDLPPGEADARDLALAVVREAELDRLRRGVRTCGFAADAIFATLVVLPGELGRDALIRLANWTERDGPLIPKWPRAWRHLHGSGAADWDTLMLGLHRARRDLCRRAFLRAPYCLAPAVALLLLQEEEVHAVTAIAASVGIVSSELPASFERVLAASAMGR